METTGSVTCRAPINIAIIKYWGKKNENDILPLNDSLSLTLDIADLASTTTVAIDQSAEDDQLMLNGKVCGLNARSRAVLQHVRKLSGSGVNNDDSRTMRVVIRSRNNFPTASGLASSASGYAALTHALCTLFKVPGEWSGIARRGSGSACRSMLGGFVLWKADQSADDAAAAAVQIQPESHWPELRVLILVSDSDQKSVSSTEAMRRSVQTSELLRHRAEEIVPERTKNLIKAINERDFPSFADICMKESNQLHAICMDTMPPVRYLSQTSFHIMETVCAINANFAKPIACYTFDAGPNAFVIFEQHNRDVLYDAFSQRYPDLGLQYDQQNVVKRIKMDISGSSKVKPVIHSVIETRVGSGPVTEMSRPETE